MCFGGTVLAAPQATVAIAGGDLDFTFEDPQRLTVTLPGSTEPATYWYMLYQVTNNTGKDQQFFPSFSLVTDELEVVQGGSDIDPRVYDIIAARHDKAFPFMAPPAKVTGLLLQGEENSRSSVAVFRTFGVEANRFTVYASGLSSRLARVANPAFIEGNSDPAKTPKYFILRRTLAITYDLPGDAATRMHAKPVRRSREWVMR